MQMLLIVATDYVTVYKQNVCVCIYTYCCNDILIQSALNYTVSEVTCKSPTEHGYT